jgi:hypothetical protein
MEETLPDVEVPANILLSSHGQPTKCGFSSWVMGKNLTTPLCLTKYHVIKKYLCLNKHQAMKTYGGMEV